MKLWLIVYVAGQIGMTVGPLPYGMDECLVRADDKLAEIHDESRGNVTKETVAATITIKCEWSELRPAPASDNHTRADSKGAM